MSDYKTTLGRKYSFSKWGSGLSPIELFDSKKWCECTHSVCFMLSRLKNDNLTQGAIEDDGILHELIHLVCSIEISTHNLMSELRNQVLDIQTRFERIMGIH